MNAAMRGILPIATIALVAITPGCLPTAYPETQDSDGDGTVNEDDCAPDDASIHPLADDDCDGAIDTECGGSREAWLAVDAGQCDAPTQPRVTLSAGLDHSCGLADVGTVLCWGDDTHGQASLP
jgi:hypothetical protein